MERLQEQGRACYKRRDYATALQHFDRALQRGQSVQLFDNRAACHEKLNDLPAALKDAKKSIQLHGEDPTGYLRAGKLLLRMEKESVAEEIFRHGLKRVKHVGQGYELLRAAHEAVRNQLCPPNSVDPMTMLPREVAELILEYLSFRQLINTSLVSKEWARFIRSTPNLWSHLDLSDTGRKVKTTFVSRAINIGRQRLKKASLANLFDFEKTLTALVRHCPLEELTLSRTPLFSLELAELMENAKHLKALRLESDAQINRAALEKIIILCPSKLEDLRIREFEPGGDLQALRSLISAPYLSIRVLSIGTRSYRFTRDFYHSIATNMPNLQSLKLQSDVERSSNVTSVTLDLTSLTKLTDLDLRIYLAERDNLRVPTSLLKLAVINTRSQYSVHWNALIQGPIPHLKELSLNDSIALTGSLTTLLDCTQSAGNDPNTCPEVGPASKIESLSTTSPRLPIEFLELLISHPRLHDLRHLELTESQDWKDESAETAINALKKLQSVDFSGTAVTGVWVKQAVKSGHIKRIVINDCRFVGHDAVEWARSQGVQVECRSKGDRTGGKKIRY